MVTNNSLMVIDPQQAIQQAKARKDIVVQMVKGAILRPGIDFGNVPGSEKPSLLKPGAERLCSAFRFDPRFDTLDAIQRWDGEEPLFFYRILCRLVDIESGLEIATGIGSCNSREAKYRWRWVTKEKIPAGLDNATLETRSTIISEFSFAIEKAETTGKYGKPAAYWQAFHDAIANGTAREVMRKTSKGDMKPAREIGSVLYRIPNDDIFSLVNTIDKMAQKRALVAATLIGANASEFFTQDIEDMPGFGVSPDGNTVEGTFEELTDNEGEGRRKTSNGRSQQAKPIFQQLMLAVNHPRYQNSRARAQAIQKLQAAGIIHEEMVVKKAANLVTTYANLRDTEMPENDALAEVQRIAEEVE